MSAQPTILQPIGKEVPLSRPLGGGKVQCTACARYCQIGEGKIGLCGIRGNIGGKLYLFVYGKVITGHIDPIEKKPVTHYRPGSKIFSIATTGCNWLCHPKGAQIMLADGSKKNVEDLVPGDRVWSYDLQNSGRIVPNVVSVTGLRYDRLCEVRYGSRGGGRLLLTSEHPVYTSTGWKPVHELKPGDRIMKVWYQNTEAWRKKRGISIARAVFHCARCGASIIGLGDWIRHRGECYTLGLEVSPEERYQRSLRLKASNPMKKPEVVARVVQTQKKAFESDPNHGWRRNVERLRHWLHRHPSEGQLTMYRLLDELGMRYGCEYLIEPENRLPRSRSRYIADAALPEAKLDIEVDGWWHYKSPEVAESDRIRDETLRLNGWTVLRIPGREVYNHPEEVKMLVLEQLTPLVRTNKRAWVEVSGVSPTDRYGEVYSFECIPNSNYVADGVLVHNCAYCQNFDISQRRKVEGIDVEAGDVAKMALGYRCQGLAYTYNEPTIFVEWARDIGVLARRAGLINIFVTNGFETPEAVAMMGEFLDCATVDFKGSGETAFVRRYIGIPSAEPIFQSLLEMKSKTNIHLEVTDLIVPEVGDSLDAADRLCKFVYDNLGPETPIHFLRFHPDYRLMHLPWTPIETLEKHHQIAKEVGLKYAYIGNVPGHPLEHTYCPECNKVVVERYGFDIVGWHLKQHNGHNDCVYCGNHVSIYGALEKSVVENRFLPVL